MNVPESQGRELRILFSPLDWGIGHASRSIFLIRQLTDAGHEVMLAADGASYFLLKSVFPDLKIIRLPFCFIRYSRHLPAIWKILLSYPRILRAIHREHDKTAEIIEQYDIDVIISDHRYGLYYPGIRSVIIIHQLYIQLPSPLSFLEPVLFRWHQKKLLPFDRIWVPDFPHSSNLAGKLSHPPSMPENLSKKVRYGGITSRFLIPEYAQEHPVKKLFDVVVVLSGPEPQRSVLEKILIRKLGKKEDTVLIIRGIPWKKQGGTVFGNIQMVSHLPPALFYTYLKKAKYIISRAGYSTIMDLVAIGKSALLIPTPGQTEQEYLAEHLAAGGYFVTMSQKDINVEEAFKKLKKIRKFPIREGETLTEEITEINNFIPYY